MSYKILEQSKYKGVVKVHRDGKDVWKTEYKAYERVKMPNSKPLKSLLHFSDSEREAAIRYDIHRLKQGLEPCNILTKKL